MIKLIKVKILRGLILIVLELFFNITVFKLLSIVFVIILVAQLLHALFSRQQIKFYNTVYMTGFYFYNWSINSSFFPSKLVYGKKSAAYYFSTLTSKHYYGFDKKK